MIDVAVDVRVRTDDEVRSLLVAQAREAHRLASAILQDTVAAEDAVQEAALLAWGRRHSLRDLSKFNAWFYRIVVNVCRQEIRHRGRHSILTEIEIGASGDHSAFPVRDELTRAIVTLNPDEQIVVGLRFGRDMTIPQIAAAIGLAEGTVKSRLHYALEHLRAALESQRRAEERIR